MRIALISFRILQGQSLYLSLSLKLDFALNVTGVVMEKMSLMPKIYLHRLNTIFLAKWF